MSKPGDKRQYDALGPVRLMVMAEGYAMVRRPGSMPFVITETDWDLLRPIEVRR